MFKAKHVMTSGVLSVSVDDTVDHAISLLIENKVSGLPVVNDAGSLVGIISELDLLELVCDCRDQEGVVADYMSPDVCSVDEDTSCVSITDMFRSSHVRRLPVTRNGKLVGIITRRDLIRMIRDVRKRLRRAIPDGASA